MHPKVSSEKLTPNIDVPIRPPRTGVNASSGVRGLGVYISQLSKLDWIRHLRAWRRRRATAAQNFKQRAFTKKAVAEWTKTPSYLSIGLNTDLNTRGHAPV